MEARSSMYRHKDFLHTVPKEIRELLRHNKLFSAKWAQLTLLAKNEWICWVTTVKKRETRQKHFIRMQKDVLASKKHPCCWPGCPHRKEIAERWFSKTI